MLGVETLAERRVRSLSRAGSAGRRPRGGADVGEPCASCWSKSPSSAIDPRAPGASPEALRARGRDGCAVVVTTASMRDAGELADDWLALRAGAIVGQAACVDTLARGGTGRREPSRGPPPRAAKYRPWSRRSHEKATSTRIERDQGSVRLRGRDATALARAVGRAALEADVDIAELRSIHGAGRSRATARPDRRGAHVIAALARPPLARLLRGPRAWFGVAALVRARLRVRHGGARARLGPRGRSRPHRYLRLPGAAADVVRHRRRDRGFAVAPRVHGGSGGVRRATRRARRRLRSRSRRRAARWWGRSSRQPSRSWRTGSPIPRACTTRPPAPTSALSAASRMPHGSRSAPPSAGEAEAASSCSSSTGSWAQPAAPRRSSARVGTCATC